MRNRKIDIATMLIMMMLSGIGFVLFMIKYLLSTKSEFITIITAIGSATMVTIYTVSLMALLLYLKMEK